MSIKIEITAETPEQFHRLLSGIFPNISSTATKISFSGTPEQGCAGPQPTIPEPPQAAPSAPEPAAPVAEPEPKKRRARKQESEAPAPEAPAPEPVVPEPPPVAASAPVEDALPEESVALPPPPSPAPAPEPLKVSSQDVLLLGCLIQYGFEDVAFIRSALAEVLGENKSLNAASPEKLAALAEKFIEAINARGDEKWRLAEERDKTLGKKHVASVAGLPRSITSRINHFAK